MPTSLPTCTSSPRWNFGYEPDSPSRARVSPLGWWKFGSGAELDGHVRGVSLTVLEWAIA
jgi:hypothetical protein